MFGVANNHSNVDISLFAVRMIVCHQACCSGTGITLPRRFRLGMSVLTTWESSVRGCASEEDKKGSIDDSGQQCKSGGRTAPQQTTRQTIQNGISKFAGRRDSTQGIARKRFHPDELDDE
jgi:hypothetical protein